MNNRLWVLQFIIRRTVYVQVSKINEIIKKIKNGVRDRVGGVSSSSFQPILRPS